MGFYNNLDEAERQKYDAAKKSYDSHKDSLALALKKDKPGIRKDMRAERATMRSIANAQRWETFSTNKHAKRALGSKATSGLAAAGKMKDMTPAQIQQGIQGVGVALKMFDFAGKALNGITGAIGLNTEQVNQAAADRAGMGGANKLTGIINKIPGAKFMTAFGATTIGRANESAYWDSVGSGFAGTRADSNAAKDLGGKRMLFGAKKAQAFVDTANAQNAAITRIGMESELARQNDVGQLYQQQNFNKYQGYSPSLLLSKKGGVIPELNSARVLLKKLDVRKVRGLDIDADINTFNKSYVDSGEVIKYQLGGKITSNYIPEGALHRNKHHIEDAAPELDGQITEKGIPVVSIADGEIQQHAEIEGNELTLSLPTTKQIEEYYTKYKEDPSDELLIECGKYFVNEVLRNTEDPGKLIKEL